MDFKIVDIFNRSVTFEMNNSEAYLSGNTYDLYVNDEYRNSVDTNVFSVFGLYPDTEYEIKLKEQGCDQILNCCVVKTKKETVLLDVSEFGAVGDGVNDYTMFQLAGYSIGVNVKEEERVDKNCKNSLEMLKFSLEYLQNIMP